MADLREGIVKESLPGLTFRVTANGEGQEFLAYLAGKMKIHHIRVVPGDRVLVEVGPDGKRGRIVKRL